MSNTNEPRWQRYRKTALIEMRVLTQEDHRTLNGVIRTLEGPKSFTVGDYLAQDSKGVWPIKAKDVRRSYEQKSHPGPDGWMKFQSKEIREAAQMSQPFTADDGLRGKAGDYLVRDSQGKTWPVDRALFERTYRRA